MSSDGKQLEALVAFVEKTLLPDGLTVSTNKRILDLRRNCFEYCHTTPKSPFKNTV